LVRVVNVYEAKNNLSKLLDAVERGEEIVIARAGRPVADLTRHVPRRPALVIGGLAAEIEFDDQEFDAVDADIMRMFLGDDWAADDPAR
jgi:antitoxin (DNA-binding transcriptional repressor) of toxin-antitoxin stability system